MAKFKYVWVQRYCRRTEEYILKVPVTATPHEVVRFAEMDVCGQTKPNSEETHELTVTFDKPATKAELKLFKKEAAVMPDRSTQFIKKPHARS